MAVSELSTFDYSQLVLRVVSLFEPELSNVQSILALNIQRTLDETPEQSESDS